MDVNNGNWFTNQPKVADAIQNLDASGNLTGDVTGTLSYSSVAIVDDTETVDLTVPVNLIDGAVTLPDGTAAGQSIILAENTKAGGAAVTGTFQGSNNTLTFATNSRSGVQLIWVVTDGSGEATSNWIAITAVDGTNVAFSTV